MSEYNESLSLARRNIEAMNEGMKHFEKMRAEDKHRVEQLQATVTQQTQQIQDLQVKVALLQALVRGHGATA